MNLSEYFAMGGYAAFVWPAYAASLVGIGTIFWVTLRDYRRAKRKLQQLETDPRP